MLSISFLEIYLHLFLSAEKHECFTPRYSHSGTRILHVLANFHVQACTKIHILQVRAVNSSEIARV